MTRLDDAIQQLNTHHDTITTIQTTQTSHSSMLETQHADIIDIKASLQGITKSIADLSPSSISPSTPTLPSSYPIKHLTYSEMQQLRDQGLCLNCNDVDTPSHRCLVKRILLVMPDEDTNIEQQSMEILKPADPKAPRFQVAALNSPIATLMNTGIIHHSLHTKTVHFLGLQFDNSSTSFMAAGNGKNMMNKELCSKDYILFFRSLVECKIKMDESKVFVFDPGGIFDVTKHIWSLTLRTRSFSERVVMIRTLLYHQHKIAAPLLMQVVMQLNAFSFNSCLLFLLLQFSFSAKFVIRNGPMWTRKQVG